jgi:uncharacterized protein YaaN involved in tellurite resistance
VAKAVKNLRPAKLRAESEGADLTSRLCVSLGRIPIIGPRISALRYFQVMREPIRKRFDEIERHSEIQVGKLQAENARMDRLVDATKAHLGEIRIQIAACERALARDKAAFAEAHAAAEKSRDPLAAADVRDWAEQINLFEARLMDMKTMFVDDLVRIPEIRTQQSAIRIEIMNAMSAVLVSLVKTKRIVVQLASLREIGKASRHSALVRQMSRDLTKAGAQILQETVLASKATLGESELDARALEDAATALLATLDKALTVDQEARAARARAEAQLVGVRDKLMAGMHKIAGKTLETTRDIG